MSYQNTPEKSGSLYSQTKSENSLKVVTFLLSNEIYGIDIMQSQEIIKMQPMTPIPNSLDFVLGVINLRGKVIPIIDLKKRFNLMSSEEAYAGIIIVKLRDTVVGITIDKIVKVIDIPVSKIQPPPTMIAGIGKEYISGVARTSEEQLIILLDIDKLLSFEEKEALSTTANM